MSASPAGWSSYQISSMRHEPRAVQQQPKKYWRREGDKGGGGEKKKKRREIDVKEKRFP